MRALLLAAVAVFVAVSSSAVPMGPESNSKRNGREDESRDAKITVTSLAGHEPGWMRKALDVDGPWTSVSNLRIGEPLALLLAFLSPNGHHIRLVRMAGEDQQLEAPSLGGNDGQPGTPGYVWGNRDSATPPVPEPSAIAVFSLGALIVARLYRTRLPG